MSNPNSFTREHLTVLFHALKKGQYNSTIVNDAKRKIYDYLAAISAIKVTPYQGEVIIESTSLTESHFMNHYEAKNIYIAVEKHLEAMAEHPPLTGSQLESLLLLIQKGPIYDGDLPSKLDRDFLVDYGLAAKVRINNEEGYQAATYKGRNAFCDHYGVVTLSDALEHHEAALKKKRESQSEPA